MASDTRQKMIERTAGLLAKKGLQGTSFSEVLEASGMKPENIVLSVDSKGAIYWNDLRIPTTAALLERLKKISVLDPQPEIQIRGDGAADYNSVGRIIYSAQRAGISKVGFITEPPARGGGN